MRLAYENSEMVHDKIQTVKKFMPQMTTSESNDEDLTKLVYNHE